MEVITIESEAFKELIRHIEQISLHVKENTKKPDPERWLDNNEASAILKVTKRTMQTYRDEGKIAFTQVGSRIHYRAADIEEFMQRFHKSAFYKKR